MQLLPSFGHSFTRHAYHFFGTQPPFIQIPPPIDVNGSGIVHAVVPLVPVVDVEPLVVVDPFVVVDPLVVVREPAREAGIQPPFTHTPPPIELNGSDVVQPPNVIDVLLLVVDDDEDVVLDDEVEDEVVVDEDEVVVPPLIPPGIHPPFTHVPPPIEANGSGVVQPAEDPEVVVTEDVEVVVVVVVDPLYMEAGTHPPPTHTPPPIEANGSGVVQPPLVDVDEDVEDDELELENESTVVPTSSRPLLIQAS